MKILIDADGCPAVNHTIRIAKKYDIECIIFRDTSHRIEKAIDSLISRIKNQN